MGRKLGRVTKRDVQAAGFRRWDGRKRITTEWVNIFHEPDLHWPNGDLLVYLREPGQSSRGPAFRIHSSRLRKKGFHSLIDSAVSRPLLPTSACALSDCQGCYGHMPALELYLPAPDRTTLDTVFEHHTNTRNVFAFIYNLPLTGKTLGQSLVDLKQRLDIYRPEADNSAELIAYADSQRYLDFRECVDHALATVHLAEALKLEDLYVDAFTHCVGLCHRGIRDSPEYELISGKTKILMSRARLDLDTKLERVAKSVANFFEAELSTTFLGLHQVARDHLDRFRSFLHGFYIEQHGFWPPDKFDLEVVQRLICNSMYSDFRSLYHHLADPNSSTDMRTDLESTGGVCVLQNIKAFDARYRYQPLPQSLPMLPSTPKIPTSGRNTIQRRNSWNPVLRRKQEKEERNAQRMQALVDSSNRDWNLMDCQLVRRYSEFEVETAVDDLETITLADARKVRWIVVYGILQTLISIMQAPQEVRNTESLSYPLCCERPDILPWQHASTVALPSDEKVAIEPDFTYSHTNTAPPPSITRTFSRGTINSTKESQKSVKSERSNSFKQTTTLRVPSLARFKSKKAVADPEESAKKRTSFCEIYIPGYGNGLNQVEVTASNDEANSGHTFEGLTKGDLTSDEKDPYDLTLPGSPSVSRESSNASTSSRSKASTASTEEVETPADSPIAPMNAMFEDAIFTNRVSKVDSPKRKSRIRIVDDDDGLETVHFNTETWDEMLRV